MNLDMNFSHDNFELELSINDSNFWSEIETKQDKKFEKLLRAMVFGFHNFVNQTPRKNQYLLSCHFCRSSEIKELNNQYRNKDFDTDVLSFPLHEDFDGIQEGLPIHLGDIYVSLDKAISQAEEFKLDTFSEIVHLCVHGFLHLLGYDHEISDEDEKHMRQLEEKLILSIKNSYSRI